VIVERVLKFLTECLDLKSLSEQLLLQIVYLLSEVSNLCGLRLDNTQLALEVGDLELEEADVLETLLILHLTLGESRLQDLDLFVEKRQFVVATDQLGAQDVTLIDHILVVLLQLLVLFMGFLDDEG
jgi:hypothetical protein